MTSGACEGRAENPYLTLSFALIAAFKSVFICANNGATPGVEDVE